MDEKVSNIRYPIHNGGDIIMGQDFCKNGISDNKIHYQYYEHEVPLCDVHGLDMQISGDR